MKLTPQDAFFIALTTYEGISAARLIELMGTATCIYKDQDVCAPERDHAADQIEIEAMKLSQCWLVIQNQMLRGRAK